MKRTVKTTDEALPFIYRMTVGGKAKHSRAEVSLEVGEHIPGDWLDDNVAGLQEQIGADLILKGCTLLGLDNEAGRAIAALALGMDS